jgi:hypothetical protein
MASDLSRRNETIKWQHMTEDIMFLANQYSDKVQTQVTPIFIVDLCTFMTDEEW